MERNPKDMLIKYRSIHRDNYKTKTGTDCTFDPLDITFLEEQTQAKAQGLYNQICQYHLKQREINDMLNWVEGLTQILLKPESEYMRSLPLIHSLWFSFIISYGRLFAKTDGGIKLNISDYKLSIENQETHDELIELRNKYVAHNVVDFDTIFCELLLIKEKESDKILGLHSNFAFQASVTPDKLVKYKILCKLLLDGITEKTKQRESSLLELLRG